MIRFEAVISCEFRDSNDVQCDAVAITKCRLTASRFGTVYTVGVEETPKGWERDLFGDSHLCPEHSRERPESERPAMQYSIVGWSGSMTCADCSSLGLDSYVGSGEPVPKTGVCGSCGGPWPKRPKVQTSAQRENE